jgi:hypothetical protein
MARRKRRLRRIPSPAQIDASQRNGKRSKGRARLVIDQTRWDALCFEGLSMPKIAAALGVSLSTLERRKAEQLRKIRSGALGE